MKNILATSLILFLLVACTPVSSGATLAVDQATATLALPPTETPLPTLALPTETFTSIPPTQTSTPTAIPFVDSLKAKVTADKLSCRYGPGANYLYLIAFNKTTPLRLVGRADGNNWVLVENEPQRCWVNSKFVQVQGELQTLRSLYPDGYKIPVSPYYGPTRVLSAGREGDKVSVSWTEVIVSPGKYESESMFPYIVEVWRCENNTMIFDTLGSRVPFVSFVDQAGCDTPSHGRVYVQEKHGYAGPADIPWPARTLP
jgi:uncharacterized protein YraI